ncbi:MAG: hypothetical protein ACI9VI_002883 [Candidatus Azotimanducaceae bacterium]
MLIYRYIQQGELKKAHDLLEQFSLKHRKMSEYGWITDPMKLTAMILMLDSDLAGALEHMRLTINEGYILSSLVKENPIFRELIAHPDWPALVTISKKNADEQRAIYLRLVADDAESAHRIK